jgi:CRISPR-associated protein Cas1
VDELYVLEPGSTIRKDGDCLKILRDGAVAATIPASGLKQLVMSGTASLSGAVLDFLITHRIDTVFMSPGGRFRARLLMDDPGHVQLRQRQYLRLADKTFKLSVARTIVREKLENQVRLLLRRASQYGDEGLRVTGVQIKALQEKLAAVDDLDQVRGIEGYGAKLFYSVFGLLLRNERFHFSGRNRRPPLDPVNALLSFVYTLLTNEVLNGIRCAGLDPYLGALHEVTSGRPALACDLVEEWRILAERMVLTLINRRAIQPEDFVYRPGATGVENGARPVEMKPAVSRALIAAYHRQLEEKIWYPPTEMKTTVRVIIHSQCRRFAEALAEEGTPYAPFRLPR